MRTTFLSAVILAFCSSIVQAQKLTEPILLWPNGAPGATGTSDEDKPAIIPFIPELSKRNGAAVLVVPGGGFTIRAVDHEGVLVAQWLKDQGITSFVLRYRLRPLYERTHWIMDGQRAMQYIRAHATDYGISLNRIGAIGFSAGATLIGDMTLNDIPVNSASPDELNRFSARPDFLIMAYGSVFIPPSADSSKVANLPPTFMYGTVEDAGSTRGLNMMYNKLFNAGVPVEAHFFRSGVHGSGLALGDPILGEWTTLLHNWLKMGGFLSQKPQCSITGIVKLDGSPLIKGMVILKPIDQPNSPPVVVYVNNTGTGEMGRFVVPKEQGPVPGLYRVEVRLDATRWTSNSRDPFMIKMMAKQREGTLTAEDKKEWGEYLRKRNLSPSIENQRVYTRQRPSDKQDYIVNIQENSDLLIEVFSK